MSSPSSRGLLASGLVLLLSGCASEEPLAPGTFDGGLPLVGAGGVFSDTGTGGLSANGGNPAPVPAGGGAPYGAGGAAYGSGGSAEWGAGGTTGSSGGVGAGGACVGFFCPLPASGGAAQGGASVGGAAGAGSCDNAICWDIFDCVIFHPDMLNCGFTKCEGFVCKK